MNFQGDRLHVDFYTDFLTQEEAVFLFEYIEKNVKWSGLITNGKRVNQNYGDDGISYKLKFGGYGGKPVKIIERKVLPWDDLPILKIVRDKLSKLTNSKYNYCVIQRYPNGNVGINPHRDKEMLSGIDSNIAGISLGSTRTLTLSPPKNSQTAFPIKLGLVPGSLYVLKYPTNEYWTHCIEKDPNIIGARISLTFRLQ